MSEAIRITSIAAQVPMSADKALVEQTSKLMGGARVLGHKLASRLDVHEAIAAGLPGSALHHLVDSLVVLDVATSLENAFGLSRRTLQRTKVAPKKPLSVEQSGRTWKFAEILARAIDVLGSQESAERWLERPAIGLDGRRPIDLLKTPAGTELVEVFLQRLKYGVYT